MKIDPSHYSRSPAHLCLASLLALAACSGGGGGNEPAAPQAGERAGALSASQPGELLGFARDKLRERALMRQSTPDIDLDIGTLAPTLAINTTTAEAGALRSGTLVQEAGVDEADLIKSEGNLIYSLNTRHRGNAATLLNVHRRGSDGRVTLAASLELPADPATYPATYPMMRGMLRAATAGRLAVFSESVTLAQPLQLCLLDADCGPLTTTIAPRVVSSQVHVQLVEAGAAGTLRTADRLTLSGRLVGTRQVGDMLYVVSTHAPVLAADNASLGSAARDAALAALSTQDLLPTLRINGGAAQPLLADTDCYLQPGNTSPRVELTTITVIDLASNSRRSRCLAGGSEAMYLSPQSLVLATTRSPQPVAGESLRFASTASTDLHKFSLSGGTVSYRGSGNVVGHLGWDTQRKAHRISEHNGYIRVITFTGEFGWAQPADAGRLSPSPATLTVLREGTEPRTLQTVSTLPNSRRPAALGKPGEQVYAVRFMGDRAYVVTFRQIDPLYVLDLSDPADPRTVGELEVPGVSEQLFSLPDGLLLGVGRQASATGARGGVKVSLFDVRDPARPRELSSQTFGDVTSASGVDYSPHGLNLLTVGNQVRVVLPLFVWGRPGGAARQGFQRFEVDVAARAMKGVAFVPVANPAVGVDPWAERSLQIDSMLYLLSQGQLSAQPW